MSKPEAMVAMAFRLTSSMGVGYWVLQWSTVILSWGVPALIRASRAASISAISAMPVERMSSFFRLPSFRR